MRTRVKICGITHPDDLLAAVELGADAVGFNFHPPSPRFVDPRIARDLVALLPPFVEAVGVFVARPVAESCKVLDGIRTVQMHAGLGDAAPVEFRLVPAYPVRSKEDLGKIEQALPTLRPVAVLVDGHAPGLHGGTGQVAPWDLLAEWKPAVPVILAGGLTPENVAEAVRRVRPYAVDVASGVESSPGRKCPEKMRRFLDAVRDRQ